VAKLIVHSRESRNEEGKFAYFGELRLFQALRRLLSEMGEERTFWRNREFMLEGKVALLLML
jgi:hypothetical protein